VVIANQDTSGAMSVNPHLAALEPMGWRDYLLVQVPTIMLAGAGGIWLFYVQHHFEDAYWEWTGCEP
jgi:acyl-lipid omega-6 desaturase (Delta-12 desaturase)